MNMQWQCGGHVGLLGGLDPLDHWFLTGKPLVVHWFVIYIYIYAHERRTATCCQKGITCATYQVGTCHGHVSLEYGRGLRFI